MNLLTLTVIILFTGVLLGPGAGRKTGSGWAFLGLRMTYGSAECEGYTPNVPAFIPPV